MAGAPDVAVIGGGIVGVSVAAHLAALGSTVILYEADAIAAAASGRNSGVVQHPFDPVLAALHRETVDLYRALGRIDPARFTLPAEPAGLLAVGHDAESVRAMAFDLAATHPDLDPRFLPPGELGQLEPSLHPAVAACRLAIGYPVAPAAATRAYAAWAESLGAVLMIGRAARPWIRDGRAVGVEHDGEHVATGTVVVAAGPWTPELIDPTGAWRPIRSVWGVVVDVAIGEPPRHVLEQADIDIEPADGSRAEAPASAGGIAFSLVPAGTTSTLGSTFRSERPDPVAAVPGLVEHGTRYVPALARARLGESRVCARPQSIDGRPLLGMVPGIDGLWIAAGHGPWGISTGPASGRLVADLVAGRLPASPPALDPSRFGPVPPRTG